MSSSRIINDAIMAQAAQAGLKTDSGETAFFVRQLEDISATLYNQLYPELVGRSLLPLKTDINPGANEHTWRGYEIVGDADEIDSYSDDAPEVELDGGEVTSKIIPIRGAYGFSIQDIRAAQFAGVPLDSMKAMAAREIMERKFDTILAKGSKNRKLNGVYGFYNSPLYPSALDVTAQNTGPGPAAGRFSGSSGTTWDLTSVTTGKTPQQIAADLNSARSAIRLGTLGVHDADSVVFDLKSDTIFSQTNMNVADGTTYSSVSVKQYLMQTCSWIKNWEVWNKGDTASDTGTALVMVYEKKPRNYAALLPQDFEQFPPQLKGMKFGVECHMRTGGVIVRYPKAFQLLKKPYGS